ncbi:MAG TPA: hypothetical protein VMW25_06665 [Clostridia bacterium]|nr:hypothetical protein [Clostridia bacterium]
MNAGTQEHAKNNTRKYPRCQFFTKQQEHKQENQNNQPKAFPKEPQEP